MWRNETPCRNTCPVLPIFREQIELWQLHKVTKCLQKQRSGTTASNAVLLWESSANVSLMEPDGLAITQATSRPLSCAQISKGLTLFPMDVVHTSSKLLDIPMNKVPYSVNTLTAVHICMSKGEGSP